MPLGWHYSRLGLLRKSLMRHGSIDHWRVKAKVRRGMELPSGSITHSGSEIWAVLMVKNEQDILRHTLAHIFNQGFDRALIVDNLSTDATQHVLHELSKTYPLVLGQDREPTYFQSEKMTFLARWAARHGAGWVVPTDADEFWYAEETTVGDFLRETSHSVIEAAIHNLFPVEQNPNPTSPTSGPLRFDYHQYKLPKVAVRASQQIWLGMGNHWGQSPGSSGIGLHVAHLPWRSEEQLTRKLRQGAAALQGTSLAEHFGGHWRQGAERSDEELHAAWLGLLEGKSDPVMGWAPEGPFALSDPAWWSATWPKQLLSDARETPPHSES